jgi:flavorubredoxin
VVKIKDNIYWTGCIDWDLRSFHAYSTPHGSTYNAYVVVDEKPTLIDTVKDCGASEMLSQIKRVVDPSDIQYIISNHSEMDHSGAIDQVLEFCPQAEVVCSPKGGEILKRHYNKNWKLKIVGDGESLSIGKRTFKFFHTPMVHWPDSMASYLKEDKVLFSNDAFGQHYACPERFAEEVGLDIAYREAKKYYANIIMPYGAQVQKALGELGGLDMEVICPSHGLIWRRKQDLETVVALYDKWSNYVSEKRVCIAYNTMWGSTERLARKLYELIDKESIPVALLNLEITDISDVLTEIVDSRVLALGSSILNSKMLPKVGAFLTYLEGLKPKNRLSFTFGSYGWSPAAFGDLENSLKQAGLKPLSEGKYFQYIPQRKEIESLSETVAKIKDAFRR